MARRSKHSKKSVKLQVEQLERKCRYCKSHQNRRGFDKHEAWCKKTWIIRQELRDLRVNSIEKELGAKSLPTIAPIASSPPYFDIDNEFMEGSSSIPTGVTHLSHLAENTTGPSQCGELAFLTIFFQCIIKPL